MLYKVHSYVDINQMYQVFMSQLDGSQCVSVPPSWLEKPSNREVTLGQKVELPCRADGAPLPKITWKKEIGKRNKTLTMMRLIKVKRS